VAKEQVHIVELEAFERTVNAFDEPLAVERILFVHAIMQAPIELCRNKITAATPFQLLERCAHYLFRFAACVHFGVVEKVHARIVRRCHHFDRGFDICLVVKRDPRAERKLADANP
jgi:hypothetical protein